MISGVCAAQILQIQQFQSVPQVLPTSGQVASFLTGSFQAQSTRTDFLYVNAPVGSGSSSTITAGVELAGPIGQGFSPAGANGNSIQFTGVSNVVAAVGDFDSDGFLDFAFALTPSGSTTTNLCVYYGTGANEQSQTSSFNGGGSYPAQGINGCTTFPTNQSLAPNFAYIAAMPFTSAFGSLPQLLVEDSANKVLYVLSNAGDDGNGGALVGFQVVGTIALPDGAGPIYTGDFDGDGNMDFVVNGQTGYAATVFMGNGNGTFRAPVRYVFDDGVRSMLMQDMNFDHIQDMVVETNHGVIEIHRGASDGTFSPLNSGGTPTSPGSAAGNGGHLAAINPNTLDILTTTPIGLSLLRNSLSGLVYGANTIYNIGPGRSSFALADVYGAGNLDLAVDSAEGIALIAGNADGTFQSSKAFSALAPALGAVAGKFRNSAGVADVVVATGATQAQFLKGDGAGNFSALASPVNSASPPNGIPNGVWSNILAGDFDGDGKLDIAYSLTGSPQTPPSGTVPILYTQYGNGDGTFAQSGFAYSVPAPPANSNGVYIESGVGDFNGDGISDVASSDAFSDGTGLGAPGRTITGAFVQPDSSNASFSQVAVGFFNPGRTTQQDAVFEQGANLIPYLNAKDGTGKNFTAQPALIGPGAPLYPSTVLLTDMDGDGFGDIVVVYNNTAPNPLGAGPVFQNNVYIWYGMGDGKFLAQPQVLKLTRNYSLGAVADMNGDGFPDLVLSDGSLISILYNEGGRNFGTPLASGLYPGEQHFVAGQGINSISLVDVNGDSVPDVVAANGGATISNALALGAKTASFVNLALNPTDINTGGITVLLNHITTKPVTGTLVANAEPSQFGAAFTMTATLNSSAGIAPVGQVAFYLDGTLVGTGTLAPLQGSTITSAASFTVPQFNTYAGGVHPMSAVFNTDGVNTAITLSGAAGTHLIQSSSTISEIFMCIGPSIPCPAPPGVPNPSPPYSSTLRMYYGQIWNGFLDARAADNSALTGTVELIDTYTGPDVPPPNPLCVLPVNSGGACANSVGTTQGTSVGLNVLTAFYPGDATHTQSTSLPTAITVLPDTTSATLTGSPNPSPALQPVTFTATVTGNFVAPAGPIAFFFGNTLLGQVQLVPGSGTTSTASVTTSILPVGSDVINVNYGATEDFNGASASFTEIITPSLAGSFKLTIAPNPVSVGVGYASLLAVTVTPVNGFSQDVNLSCANLPNEGSCFFDSTTITGGSGTTNLVVGTTAPHSCGTTQPYFLGSNGGGGLAPYALPAIAGLLAMFLPGRRRWLRALLAMIVAVAAVQMGGCGNCTDLGTRPATYTFTVTGTSAGTSEVEAQTVTITVTI
jgi:hypothetical protein